MSRTKKTDNYTEITTDEGVAIGRVYPSNAIAEDTITALKVSADVDWNKVEKDMMGQKPAKSASKAKKDD